MPEARGGGGEPVFNGDGVSVWEDEDVPRMGVDQLHNHDSTEYPTTVHLTGSNGKFYVLYILPQF